MIKLKCNRKDAISTHYVGKEEKLTVYNILLNGMLDYIILPCMKSMSYLFEEAYIFGGERSTCVQHTRTYLENTNRREQWM